MSEVASDDGPREGWEYHLGFYRHVDTDLSKSWRPSPQPKDPPLPPLTPLKAVFQLPGTSAFPPNGENNTPTSQTVTIDVPTSYPVRQLGLWARIRRFVNSGSFSRYETVKVDIPVYYPAPVTSSAAENNKLQPHEWKDYGYWAVPMIRGVECYNTPASSEKSISTLELREIIDSLRGENNSKHPERWVAGLKHRSLPPKPSRWKTPVPGEPLPFPWEVELNPILRHHLWGPPPLSWIISSDPVGHAYLGRSTNPIVLNNADLAQPATFPYLTHMHFNAVSGDAAHSYPWPFTVINERGIKVGDVLREIWMAFQRPVSEDERSSWAPIRRDLAAWSLDKRCRVTNARDDMRRCDAFGCIAFFRGIEPTIDGGGWMITLGNF